MIVSASYRTDIPAFYGEWFLNRLAAGWCEVSNPYSGKRSQVSLRPDDVDGFVFWSRNIRPFVPALAVVERLGVPFIVQFTVTNYPRALERSVPAAAQAIAGARQIRDRYGPRALIWRYDPILIADPTPPDWHHENFSRLARALEGVTDEVVVSFAQMYRKTARNLTEAAAAHGFGWHDPEAGEKRALVAALAERAAMHGLALRLCTQPDLADPAVPPARCIDVQRLSDVAGHSITRRVRGNRPGCLCAESRDIGAYESCPHGCVYCYAVASRTQARLRHRAHSADGPSLAPSY